MNVFLHVRLHHVCVETNNFMCRAHEQNRYNFPYVRKMSIGLQESQS